MTEESFVNEFVSKLNGKVQDDDLKTIMDELYIYLADYSVEKKSTELAVTDNLPASYKAFMVTKKIEGLSDESLKLYKLVIEDAIDKFKKPLEDITANDIRLYLLNSQKVRNICERTLDNRRHILSSFFTWLHQEGYISNNPSGSVKPIKYEKKPVHPFTDIELELIRDACKTVREKAIIELFYSSGCRVSELINIKVSDINFDKREVYLFGKGKKHRTSLLNAKACIALKRYLKERKGDSEYVFLSTRFPYNRITSRNSIENIVRVVGLRAGVLKTHPHRIRHTTATDAIERGMPITDLKELLGHNSIETSMLYTKVSHANVAYNHHRCII